MIEIRRDLNRQIVNYQEILASCSPFQIERAMARLETTNGYEELIECFPKMKKAMDANLIDANRFVNCMLLEVIIDALKDAE